MPSKKIDSNFQHSDLLGRLTKRELEVLDGILDGKHYKQIAGDLRITNKTVEFHRANIMKKLQAKSLADLVKKVVLAKEL